ncbi:hypothetical protein RchiOBHm_Chr3g0477331 [Rosa chinensis]|uniref:Uncharacterized protein n=1 Tax=Rosa chinensis TaxID=74649 RepID=A0A2P6RCW1_ROSCH|nr:hypothetical protein RchiOBHm_Chr3g0477331 [Rosa chinensis]
MLLGLLHQLLPFSLPAKKCCPTLGGSFSFTPTKKMTLGLEFLTSHQVCQVLSFSLMCQTLANMWFFSLFSSLFSFQRDNEYEELCSVFVPTNHLYIGEIFLVDSKYIIRPNLSIREGIEIIVSGGMTMPQIISAQERVTQQSDN